VSSPPLADATVFVVDDDGAMRRSVVFLAESVGWRTQAFADAESFLAQAPGSALGCLVLDVRMPTMSGLELQQAMNARGLHLPIIFITGHGDVSMAVQAMKDGAVDFIEKPFKDQVLLDAIALAVRHSHAAAAQGSQHDSARQRYEQLTLREREIAQRVARGQPSKLIARELGISDKTVQVHRTHILEKMAVHSAAELAHHLTRIDPSLQQPAPLRER
jgi:two-component system, LuxR family, response regulator FixJ